MTHWYWCVDCPRERCGERQPLRYIGPVLDWPDGPEGDTLFPPVTMTCSRCDHTTTYTQRDVRAYLLAGPPDTELNAQ
jgi:hypothetical protein